jgi:hypothetical protein
MVTNGRLADEQLGSYLSVLISLADYAGDFPLTFGQAGDLDLILTRPARSRQLSDQARGHRGIEPCLARVDPPDSLDQHVFRLISTTTIQIFRRLLIIDLFAAGLYCPSQSRRIS